jgi:hypothetical protein
MELQGHEKRYKLVNGPFDGGICKGETPFVVMAVPRESGSVQKFAIYQEYREFVEVVASEKIVCFMFVKTCNEREIEQVMEELDPGKEEEKDDVT